MFLKAGHQVVGLDTHLYRSCTFGAEPVAIPEIVKDLRDVETSDLEGFDAVIHLAALSNDPLGNLDPQLTFDINHLGFGAPGAEGQRSRSSAVPVLLILQHLRVGRR